MASTELDGFIKSARAEVNDYLETVQGVFALCHEIRFDSANRCMRGDVPFCLGRRMTTSTANRISPSTEVSPDLVAQPDQGYGIVVEARLRFPKDATERLKKVEQLQKYDDDLLGWYTESGRVMRSDVVLLTHDDHAVEAGDYIDDLLRTEQAHFDNAFSIIGCIRHTDRFGGEVVRIRRGYGRVSDDELDGRLRKGRSIRLETLTSAYWMELYDQPPHRAHMMRILWTDVFPTLIQQEQFIESRGSVAPSLQVTADEITDLMRKMFSQDSGTDRVPGVPLRSWVVTALDNLCRLRYAKHIGVEYEVSYRQIKSPLDTFIRRLCLLDIKEEQKRQPTAPETGQPKLFGF